MKQLDQLVPHSYEHLISVIQTSLDCVLMVYCLVAENMPEELEHGLGPELHCQGKVESLMRQLSSQLWQQNCVQIQNIIMLKKGNKNNKTIAQEK